MAFSNVATTRSLKLFTELKIQEDDTILHERPEIGSGEISKQAFIDAETTHVLSIHLYHEYVDGGTTAHDGTMTEVLLCVYW